MNLYDSLGIENEVKKYINKKDERITPAFKIVENRFDSFLAKINSGEMSDEQIQENIVIYYDQYLNYNHFINPDTRVIFQGLWTNDRFLYNFISVLNHHPNIIDSITKTRITSINTIVYDYYYLHKNEKSNTLQYLMQICKLVDNKYIIPLTTIMYLDAATMITIANFSSTNKEITIKRLNMLIVKMGYNFSVKDIVYIYKQFYLDGFSELFDYTMTTVLDNLTPDEQRNDDNISFAIINILDSMPSSEIFEVLKRYGNFIQLMRKGSNVRFSLRSLSADFSRITAQVINLENMGIYVL